MGLAPGPPGRLRGGGTIGRRGMYSPIRDPGMACRPVALTGGPGRRDMLLMGGAWMGGGSGVGMDTPTLPMTGLKLEFSSAREEPPLLGRSASGVEDLSTFLKALATSAWLSLRTVSGGVFCGDLSSLDSIRPCSSLVGDSSSALGSSTLCVLGDGACLKGLLSRLGRLLTDDGGERLARLSTKRGNGLENSDPL